VSPERPLPDEYGAYYANYIKLVPEGDIVDLMSKQIDAVCQVLLGLSDAQANYRFAPKEWSVKEVTGHMNDTERVFSYRALRISRNDQTPLSGFEQDDYVRESNYSTRTLADLVQEFEHLRRANMLLFKNLPAETYLRSGTASNNPVTVRALLYMMVGHVNHHLGSLRTDYSIG
jgi:hypothetical protein